MLGSGSTYNDSNKLHPVYNYNYQQVVCNLLQSELKDAYDTIYKLEAGMCIMVIMIGLLAAMVVCGWIS